MQFHSLKFAAPAVLVYLLTGSLFWCRADQQAASEQRVSLTRDVMPILRAKCQGCHQPAKGLGGYVVTQFDRLVASGESGDAAVVAGQPDQSELLRQIKPVDGSAAMPKDSPALSSHEIELIERWIAAGAVDDTATTADKIDASHPPVYTHPSTITSMAFSSDGKWLAVNGFHEALLLDAQTFEVAQRLVGLSERIESLTFSPDSTLLAVTGGSPGRFGEVQIWSVPQGQLVLSHQVTYDSLFGGAFSPDGKLLAFGATDRVVRAIETQTGKQVLHQGTHEDWPLATVFNPSGTHLVSAGRDMTLRLTEVATERFIDNITSITPGALKGGINALAMHSSEDQVLVGGSDGVPKIYRIFRQTERRIGDDSNLIRQFPEMPGRIFDVDLDSQSKMFAVASTLDGASQLAVFPYDAPSTLPDDVKAAMAKAAYERNEAEKQLIQDFQKQTAPAMLQLQIADSLYAIDLHPSGTSVATAGASGMVRIYSVPSGEVIKEFVTVPLSTDASQAHSTIERLAAGTGLELPSDQQPQIEHESSLLPTGAIRQFQVHPTEIHLTSAADYVQLVITATYEDGQVVDVTRLAKISSGSSSVSLDAFGMVRSISQADQTAQQQTVVDIEFQEHRLQVPVRLSAEDSKAPDFVRDINPVLTRLGCNSGTCHGAQQGKNGFQLSLRGYDPVGDLRALGDDLRSRRLNSAAPDSSLMLMKPVGTVPHVGGMLMTQDSTYYHLLRQWIAAGARLDTQSTKVQRIEIFPTLPIIDQPGAWQQFRITAYYPDGTTRDVTQEAVLESSNTEVCQSLAGGRIKALRRGEASMLARYEGAYAAASVTVMGDRQGFQWQQPDANNTIDQLVANKWQRLKILPSQLCDDSTFLRRVRLDLTGLPPTVDELQAFLADHRPSSIKRQAKVNQLLGSEDYVEHWTNKWSDLLQVNSKFLGGEGAAAFRGWIRRAVAENWPYDQFVTKLLTATGSNKEHPEAAYYKILRQPELMMENTTHLFLAVRFNCNKCHDHPFERWTQDQYYQLAAYFAQTELQAAPASEGQTIGGTNVEGAKPLYEKVQDRNDGEIKHARTGQTVPPQFPYPASYQVGADASRRQHLAAWIVSRDNPYFATSMVNRLWGYLTGTGLIEPLDDIRAGNPASNPELLNHLRDEFIRSDFDVQHVLRLICNSRTYQLSVAKHDWNSDDHTNFSSAKARRLPAEVLYDTVYRVTGTATAIPGVQPGTRAAQLPDVTFNLADGFLNNLGRPPRESACECERSQELQLGPVMALVSGPTVGAAISDGQNELVKLTEKEISYSQMIQEIYLRILNRYPTSAEIEVLSQAADAIDTDHQALTKTVAEKEQWWIERRATLEAERLAKLETVRQAAQARRQEIAPEQTRLEQERQARIAATQQTLDEYARDPVQIANNYLASNGPSSNWFPLAAVEGQSTNGAVLTPLADRSLVASGNAQPGTYTVRLRTPLKGIRGFRLETLPLDSQPGGGPGLSANGNFVITEIEIDAAPLAQPDQRSRQKIATAKASFTQAGFNHAAVIDGQARDQGGWAVYPLGGIVHWLTLSLEQPIDFADGTELSLAIHQYHNAENHRLARFRISATTDQGEIPLGEPEEFTAARAIASTARTAENLKGLLAFLDKSDAKWNELRAALATAQTPVPADPQLVMLETETAELEKTTADDPQLVQLRADLESSQQQLKQKRLTQAQDLAWALINSPAFLFNR
jgi:WD40 repeat protein